MKCGKYGVADPWRWRCWTGVDSRSGRRGVPEHWRIDRGLRPLDPVIGLASTGRGVGRVKGGSETEEGWGEE